jgi:trehalose-6-phosphate synthase
MAPEERRERAAALRRLVEEEDIIHWLGSQFEDLLALSTTGSL